MNYIQRMRNLREDHDKTQQNIADILGTSQTMYARYERGANELPIHHLITLCDYYHVSADYFLGLSDHPGFPKKPSLTAIVTGNFVDISFFITYSVIGNRKTRYVLPESFKTRLFWA